jgi:hypothetical protein
MPEEELSIQILKSKIKLRELETKISSITEIINNKRKADSTKIKEIREIV